MSGESGMLGIDHVQLAIPPDTEDTCRRFYVDVLGMREIAKPPALAARGGLWVESGGVQLHFGVETEFHPARKAHPAIAVTDLNHWAKRLADAGHTPH